MTLKSLNLILHSLKADRSILSENIRLREVNPKMFRRGTIEEQREKLIDIDVAIGEVLAEINNKDTEEETQT